MFIFSDWKFEDFEKIINAKMLIFFLIQKSKIKKKCNIFKIKFLEFLNFKNFDQKFYSLQKSGIL